MTTAVSECHSELPHVNSASFFFFPGRNPCNNYKNFNTYIDKETHIRIYAYVYGPVKLVTKMFDSCIRRWVFSSQTSKEIYEGGGDDNEADTSKDIAKDVAADGKTYFTYSAA